MSKDELDKIKWTLNEIVDDMQRDTANFDGMPFNGRTVAEYFGNQGAAVAALANISRRLLDEVTSLREELLPRLR